MPNASAPLAHLSFFSGHVTTDTQGREARLAPPQQQTPAVLPRQASRVREGGSKLVPPEEQGERPRKVRLFGLQITDTTLVEAAAWILDRAANQIPTQVSFLNAHCVNVMRKDAVYTEALASSDRILADGSGLAIAARAFGFRLRENVNGTDLFPVLCAMAARSGARIYLMGGRPGIAAAAAERMERAFPGVTFAGSHHGYVSTPEDERAVIDEINASGVDIVLIGLGVPSQELWIARNRQRLQPSVLVGVGGLFDYYSGRIPRAPRALRALGLEWGWRLAMEPRRLANRYLVGNVVFLAHLALLRLTAPEQFSLDATR